MLLSRITQNFFDLFIELPENPRLSSLGMNGARSEAE
jgi:hypothetical protein